MDAFEAARAKHAKNLERKARAGYFAHTVEGAPKPPEEKAETFKAVSNTAEIAITVSVGDSSHEYIFQIPNMIASIHGFTPEKLRIMLKHALMSQFGKRIEDVNDIH